MVEAMVNIPGSRVIFAETEVGNEFGLKRVIIKTN